MDLGQTGFSNFDIELEDLVVRKTKKFERLWKIGKGGSICFTLLHRGVCYFGAMDGFAYAVDCNTGKEKWRTKLGGIVMTNPCYQDGKIYLPCYDGNMYCMEADSGKILWMFRTGGEIFSSPGHSENRIYFGSQDGNVYCIDSETGDLIWRFRTGDEVGATPTIHGGRVFIGSFDGYFYCLDAKTGKEVWRFKTGDHVHINHESPVVNNMIFCASFDNYLYAVDVKTGKELWRFRTGRYGNSTLPVLYKNILYISIRDGVLYALDLKGKELWRFTSNKLIGKISAGNDRIYFGGEDNCLHALDTNGKELWEFRAGYYIYDKPWIYKDKIVFGSWDCHLYAVDAKTGKEVWRFATSSQEIADLLPARECFEVQVKQAKTEEEIEQEEKYEVNVSTGLKDEYETGNEYQVKVEYQQSMKY